METVLAVVVSWWKVEACVAAGAIALAAAWRWLLADFVLERLELP